jgi:hypothetical protein
MIGVMNPLVFALWNGQPIGAEIYQNCFGENITCATHVHIIIVKLEYRADIGNAWQDIVANTPAVPGC